LKKISGFCNEISNKLLEISKIFQEAGRRKAADVCISVIEGFGLSDALKEFFYICVIADFAAGLHFHGYDFSQSGNNSEGGFVYSKSGFRIYTIIKSAAEQFIKKKYSLNERTFQNLLEEYGTYRNLHSLISEIFRDITTAYSSYNIIKECPSLFLGNEQPLFSEKHINEFKSCKDLSDLDRLVKKIKKEKYLTPFEQRVEFSKIEPIIKEKQIQSYIIGYITRTLQGHLDKTAGKKKKQPIFKGKPSFFDNMTFLDKYTFVYLFPDNIAYVNGYENFLKDLPFNKEAVYKNLLKWAALFSK